MAHAFPLGSRASPLALAQTEEVIHRLQGLYPGYQFPVIRITTTGDELRRLPLPKIGGKGVFVREIEEALLRGEIRLAVHSFKDLPTTSPPGLTLVAVLPREDPRDVLVSRSGLPLSRLPPGTRLGTSSLRRAAQVKALRPDLGLADLRGNLDTRLRKVATGVVDAAILAAAGLKRMGWLERVTEYLAPEVCLPAVGQGALVVEAREDDEEILRLVVSLDNPTTRQAITAERAFLSALGGGCNTPIAALGEIRDGVLTLWGMVARPDGSRLLRDRVEGGADAPKEVGTLLAERLLQMGAREVLEAG